MIVDRGVVVAVVLPLGSPLAHSHSTSHLGALFHTTAHLSHLYATTPTPPHHHTTATTQNHNNNPGKHQQDLTTALTAFCSMRRMVRKDILADFVAQVSGGEINDSQTLGRGCVCPS